MRPKDIVPSILTLGNMFCGFLSVFFSFEGSVETSAWLIILAGFLDGLDGKLACFTCSTSQFGTTFDSFADMVSFGLAPAALFYSSGHEVLGKWILVLSFVFVAAGAFRLVRFNLRNEFEEKEFFNGLPMTAAGMTMAGYLLFCYEIWRKIHYPVISILTIGFFSALMAGSLRYDSLPKFSFDNGWNRVKLVYVFLGVVAILIKSRLALFPLGMIYVFSGIVRRLCQSPSTKKTGPK